MRERYSIAEWFGLPFARMPASQRQALAKAALGQQDPPLCPFQPGKPGGGVLYPVRGRVARHYLPSPV